MAYLGSLPGQPAYEQVDQAVGQHLKVIPPRCLPPQMLVDAGIAHCAAEVLWLLLIPHMKAAGAAPPACCRANREKGLGVKASVVQRETHGVRAEENPGSTQGCRKPQSMNAYPPPPLQLHASLMPGRLPVQVKRQQGKCPDAAGCLTQSKIHQVKPVGL